MPVISRLRRLSGKILRPDSTTGTPRNLGFGVLPFLRRTSTIFAPMLRLFALKASGDMHLSLSMVQASLSTRLFLMRTSVSTLGSILSVWYIMIINSQVLQRTLKASFMEMPMSLLQLIMRTSSSVQAAVTVPSTMSVIR